MQNNQMSSPRSFSLKAEKLQDVFNSRRKNDTPNDHAGRKKKGNK